MIRRIIPKSVVINWLNTIKVDYITELQFSMLIKLYGQDLEIKEEENGAEE